jgi:hypothetical protein
MVNQGIQSVVMRAAEHLGLMLHVGVCVYDRSVAAPRCKAESCGVLIADEDPPVRA